MVEERTTTHTLYGALYMVNFICTLYTVHFTWYTLYGRRTDNYTHFIWYTLHSTLNMVHLIW